MLLVVTGVSLLVQIYSLGYMKDDPGISRYFAYMSLFTASMLGLVLSANIVQLYAFWELVGLSSYLLIGFWHDRPSVAAAAKKAFIITRIGDVGFLLAIIYLFYHGPQFAAQGLNPLHIPDILQAAQPVATESALLGGTALTLVCLGIFAARPASPANFPAFLAPRRHGRPHAGQRADSRRYHGGRRRVPGSQILPAVPGGTGRDAGGGPGGRLHRLCRGYPGPGDGRHQAGDGLFHHQPTGLHDGSAGLGRLRPALFHLFTHAFFKALRFLGAGSVSHATGTFNMRYMGGMRRHMPWTYVLLLVGGLSLVGIVPLAGFWSKDEIITAAWLGGGPVEPWVARAVFGLLAAAVLLTAFYTFRMILLTFHGEFRGGGAQELQDAEADGLPAPTAVSDKVHLTESPKVMVAPMLVLGLRRGWPATSPIRNG